MRSLMRAWLVCLCLVGVALSVGAQPAYQHPQQVVVKPPTAQRTADAFTIWGGLKAGTTGTVTVINADGTLNLTPTLPTCALNQILKFNGTSWACATDVGSGSFSPTLADGTFSAPSLSFAADANTGLFRVTDDTLGFATAGTEQWRIDSAGRLGAKGVTPQQQLHLYQPSAAVGLFLENGAASQWELLGSTNLTVRHVEADKTALTLEATTGYVGILTADPTEALSVTGNATLSGNINVGGYVTSHLIPQNPDTYDLGAPARPWANIWASQLNTVIFAEATAQLFGGYSIVGVNAGTIDAQVTSGATQVNFGKALGTLPLWVIIRAHDASGSLTPKTEYLRVTSLVSGTTYNVERDITGLNSPDPEWPDGTAYLVLGTQGSGRLEMYANTGVPSLQVLLQEDSASGAFDDTLYDPRDQIGVLWVGGLDGCPTGCSTGRYGIYIGSSTDTSQFLKYQRTLGAPTGDDNTLIVQGTLRATAGWFGTASNTVAVDASGLTVGITGRIAGGASAYATGTGFWMGYDGGVYKFRIGDPAANRVTWDGSVLTVRGSLNADDLAAGTINVLRIGTDSLTATHIAAGAITASELAANSITAADMLANTITASQIAANTITAAEINTDAITADELAANSVTASELAANSITAGDMLANTITANEIASNAITSDEFSATSGAYVGASKSWQTAGGQLLYCATCGPGSTAGGQFYVGDGGVTASDRYLQWDGQLLTFRAANTSLDASGNLTATSATLSGSVTSTSGTIGGWTLGATSLTSGSGATTVGIDSGGTNPAFYAGSATPASAPFRVTNAGALTSTSGTIGGWTLGATALTSGSGATTVGLDSGGTNPAFYAGSDTPASAPFRVTTAGALTATNATVTLLSGVVQTAASCGSAATACVELETGTLRWYSATPALLGQIDSTGIRLTPSNSDTTFQVSSTYGFTNGNWTADTKAPFGISGWIDETANRSGIYYDTLKSKSGVDAKTRHGFTAWFTTSGGVSSAANMELTADGSTNLYFMVDSTLIYADIDADFVGIGTSSPATRLDVHGTNTSALRIRGTDNSNEIADLFVDSIGHLYLSTAGSGETGTKIVIDTNSNTAGLRLVGTDATNEKIDLYVGSNGQLVISGADTGDSGYITIDPESTIYGLLLYDAQTGSTAYANFFVQDTTVDFLNIRLNAAASTVAGLFVDDDDQVGVQTSTPAYDLDVNGTINATTYRVGGTAGASGTCSAVTVSNGIVTGCTP